MVRHQNFSQQYLRHVYSTNLSDSYLSINPRLPLVSHSSCRETRLWLLQLATVCQDSCSSDITKLTQFFYFSCWTHCGVFGTFTHPLCLFYLKMWQMMTMTSLIRTGFSGLSLRNTSSKEGGGGERAAGWKKGRFWVGTDTEEFVPDAADSVKAVW